MDSRLQSDAPSSFWRRIIRHIGRAWHTFVNLIRCNPSGFLIIFIVTTAGFLVAVAGNLGEELVSSTVKGEGFSMLSLLLIAATCLFAFLLASVSWVMRESFATLGEITFAACSQPRSVLVFFVSMERVLKEPIPNSGPLQIGEVELKRGNLTEDADVMTAKLRHPWEMILRGLAPHHDNHALKRVYLIGSSPGMDKLKDPGTLRDLEKCRCFLQPYIPKVEIITWQKGEDFEMIADVDRLLRSLVEHEKSNHQTPEKEICIDITGGQKPSSVAAAFVSLNRRITIQYVQTNHPKEAHRYDLSYQAVPHKPSGGD